MKKMFRNPNDDGVSTMTEYLTLTTVLVTMFIIMMFVVNATLMEGPSNTLKYHSYVDIGNGVSVRIVDLYVIAPSEGTIRTQLYLPDTVAGDEYEVVMDDGVSGVDQFIRVTDGSVFADVAISGIGATRGVKGRTTGSGYNLITYDSSGV